MTLKSFNLILLLNLHYDVLDTRSLQLFPKCLHCREVPSILSQRQVKFRSVDVIFIGSDQFSELTLLFLEERRLH